MHLIEYLEYYLVVKCYCTPKDISEIEPKLPRAIVGPQIMNNKCQQASSFHGVIIILMQNWNELHTERGKERRAPVIGHSFPLDFKDKVKDANVVI